MIDKGFKIEVRNNNLPRNHTMFLYVEGEGKINGGNFKSVWFNNSKYSSVDLSDFSKYVNEGLRTVIYIDLPVLLPLEEMKHYYVRLRGEKLKFFHKVKVRGDENFTSLDTTFLPRFSALEIIAPLQTIEIKNNDEKLNATKYIHEILQKITDDINVITGQRIGLSQDILSYELHYFEKKNSIYFTQANNPDFSVYIFYDGLIEIDGRDIRLSDEQNIHLTSLLLKEREKVEEYYDSFSFKNVDFSKQVDELVKSFSFYCTQSTESISQMPEERIRDLFLVPARILLKQVEGEAYNYDGKTDFKINSISNEQEHVIGEFKYWNGIKSFEDILYQGREKHSTGLEDTIYLLMLSRKCNYDNVLKQIIDNLISDNRININSKADLLNIGSDKTPLYEIYTETRRGKKRMVIGVIDLYYKSK